MKPESSQAINRRSFVQGAATVGIAGCANALGASATQEVSAGNVPEIRAPKLYPREYELVIIGGGPAGFGAAMCAASYGLKTLVIEKCGSPGGNMTNAFMCGLNPEAEFITLKK